MKKKSVIFIKLALTQLLLSFITENNPHAQNFPVLDWYYTTKGSGDLVTYRPMGVDIDKEDNIVIGASVKDIVDLSIVGASYLIGDYGESIRVMVKYSSNGHLLWAYPADFFMRVLKTDHQNNIYVGGVFGGEVNFDIKGGEHLISAQQNLDAFLAKYSPDGDLIWAFSLPGNGYCAINDISIHEASNTVSIVGTFANQVEMNPDPNASHVMTNNQHGRATMLASYTLDGQLKWVNQVFADYDEEKQTINHDSEGSIFWTNQFKDTLRPDPLNQNLYVVSHNPEFRDGLLAKYDKHGNFEWLIQIKGQWLGSIDDFQIVNDKLFVSGWLINEQLIFFYDGINYEVILNLSDKAYTRPFIGVVSSIDGDIIWLKDLEIHSEYPSGSNSRRIFVDSDENLYFGFDVFRNSSNYHLVDLNPGIDTFTIEHTSSNRQAYFAKYTSTGEFVWGFTYPDGIRSYPLYIGTTSENNLLLISHFMGQIDISAYGPAITVSSFQSPHIMYPVVIAMYKNSALAIDENELFSDILLFPNPSQNTNTLVFNQTPTAHTTIDLYDFQGRLIQPVFKGDISAGMEITVDLSGLSAGMYLYRITNNHSQQAIKFVKE